MFLPDSFLTFLAAVLLLNLSPGPDMIYIVTRTMTQGRVAGFMSSLGICTGAMVHVFAAAIGLSAILATSALAFSIIKYAGAAYLIWLGLRALMSNGTRYQTSGADAGEMSKKRMFIQGALVDILNPKVAIFFLAFLPQFVDPVSGSLFWQFISLGSIVVVIGLICEASVILTADLVSKRLRGSSTFSRWIDWVSGVVLIGLGLRLAQQDR